MVEERLGKLHGYVAWEAEHRETAREYTRSKQKHLGSLQKKRALGHNANEQTLSALRVTVRNHNALHKVHAEMLKEISATTASLEETFAGMHAELYVKEITNAAKRMHEQKVALNENFRKQERLLGGMTKELFEDLVPQLLFLEQREEKERVELERYALVMQQNATKLVSHINTTYFDRLEKLNHQDGFLDDHEQLFVHTALLGISTRIVGSLFEQDTSRLQKAEKLLNKKIKPIWKKKGL